MLAGSLLARIVASLNASPSKSRPSTESGVRPAPFPADRWLPSVAVFMHFDQGVQMHKLWRKPRPLLAAAMIAGLALVPSALAGQPVTQILTPPPPSFYTCMAVGSGTICHGTISESSGPEETGLVCGSGADAFHAWESSSLVERAARYYDRDGNLTKRVLRDDSPESSSTRLQARRFPGRSTRSTHRCSQSPATSARARSRSSASS